MSKRRDQDAAFKARVALEALTGEKTAAELTTAYGGQPPAFVYWNAMQPDQQAKKIAQITPEIVQPMGSSSVVDQPGEMDSSPSI